MPRRLFFLLSAAVLGLALAASMVIASPDGSGGPVAIGFEAGAGFGPGNSGGDYGRDAYGRDGGVGGNGQAGSHSASNGDNSHTGSSFLGDRGQDQGQGSPDFFSLTDDPVYPGEENFRGGNDSQNGNGLNANGGANPGTGGDDDSDAWGMNWNGGNDGFGGAFGGNQGPGFGVAGNWGSPYGGWGGDGLLPPGGSPSGTQGPWNDSPGYSPPGGGPSSWQPVSDPLDGHSLADNYQSPPGNPPPGAIPEPSSALLLGAALTGLAILWRRRGRRWFD